MRESAKKLIEGILSGEINEDRGRDLRKAVAEDHNCTKIAAMVVHALDALNRDDQSGRAKLVHGIVNNNPFGAPRLHAWAEIGDIAIDLTLPEPVRYTHKTEYYRVKGVGVTRCYSSEKTSINVIRYGHWGPWDDDALGDPSFFCSAP